MSCKLHAFLSTIHELEHVAPSSVGNETSVLVLAMELHIKG